MMANPWAGEVSLVVDGCSYRMKLTLGALAELEAALEPESLVALVERFETGQCSTGDLVHLLAAGLRGGGWQGSVRDLLAAEIEGGVLNALKAAGRLLALSFSDPSP